MIFSIDFSHFCGYNAITKGGVTMQNRDNKFEMAMYLAVEKHKNQGRKCTCWPYIVHIYDVMQILEENNADEQTVIVGMLHDLVEDTDVTLKHIKIWFGEDIMNMVDLLTERKGLPYVERKHLQAERISTAPKTVKMVKCADCLSNMKSICFDLRHNENIWQNFHSDRENIREHYAEMIEVLKDVGDTKMYGELKDYYNRIFADAHIKEDDKYDYGEISQGFSSRPAREK